MINRFLCNIFPISAYSRNVRRYCWSEIPHRPLTVIFPTFIQISNGNPEIVAMSSRAMTAPSSMTSVFSGTEMCRTRPVTVTYAPPAFRSSGTKYSTVTSGRSFRRAARSVKRRSSSAASCGSSSRLSAVSRAVSPTAASCQSARQTARTVRPGRASASADGSAKRDAAGG